MAVTELALLGGGGHASDLLGVIEACNKVEDQYRVIGIFDDRANHQRFVSRDVPIYKDFKSEIDLLLESDSTYLSAIGYPTARLKVAHEADRLGLRASEPVVHPGCVYIGTGVTIGAGSVVHAGASLSVYARIQAHCYISHGCLIGHDSVLGDGCAVMPGASLSGEVKLGTGVMVGSGAVILEGIEVGDWAQIGANAVVTKDVPAGVTVVGVPARIMTSGS